MVAEQAMSTLDCLCGIANMISSLSLHRCWRLIVSLILYVIYVYAGFVAMMYLAYNAFTQVNNEPIRLVTIVVAILFLLLGIVIVTLLEWIWNKSWRTQHPAQQQQQQQDDPMMMIDNTYSNQQQQLPMLMILIRILISILVWTICFYVSTYVLWWLGEKNYNDVNVMIMWILLVTVVPIMDLFNSWRVRQAIILPDDFFYSGSYCCSSRNDTTSAADVDESDDDQQSENLL